ncbi:SARP family transcriptional regulator [Rhizobium tubonense]|uniref:SARP family transcriptional regulator n=1 Tax=Rhizobium tubonense TaxID=484088 RepID=A0A2W4CXV6_9HYPH|nr:SARP family transcriptional regulator [Rhizobium tubonense]PZM16271.1 SARP family transcriptional regulator [Rhizobium tubonense]
MTFRLATFGELRLVDTRGEPVGFPVKGLLLICYLLATNREDVSRGNAARMLWESEDHSISLVNLRKTISRVLIRQAEIGVEFLKFTPTAISLDRSALDSDLAELARIEPDSPIKRIDSLVRLLRHVFLESLEFQTAAFSEWIEQERARHTGLLLRSVEESLSPAATVDDRALIKEAVLCLLRINPDGENIHQLLVDAYEADGEVDALRKIFERRKSAIWGTLSLTPDAHALEVARRVYEKRYPEARPSVATNRLAIPPDTAVDPLAKQLIPRVALLPPADIGRISSPSAMAELLIQDITIGLSAARTLRVVAPFTSAQISRHADKMALIKQHSISYFLDTRLSGGDETSLFAQLIHIANDEVVWAERFSLKSSELPIQRREIARRVAAGVVNEVQRNELAREYFEQNPAAYHHYLLGQHYLQNLTLPDIRRARREFRAALQESQYFAPALSGLARTHSREWLLTARGDIEHLRLSETHANHAIAAGQDLAAGYRELGVTKLFLGDFDESAAALQLAETLSPHYADVIADHADTLVHASLPAQGLEKIEQAIDLNPLCPDLYHWTAAGANYYLGRYEQALASVARMQNGEPAGRLSAASWAMLGNQKKARSFVRKVRESYPEFDVDEWLSIVPIKEQWQKDHYREGLLKAGF